MNLFTRTIHSPLPLVILLATSGSAFSASDLTDSLKTYSGDSEAGGGANQPPFLSGSGLDVSFVWPGGNDAWERIQFRDETTPDPQGPGAEFGASTNGGGGKTARRNYLRTVENDYHTKNLTAFVTVNRAEAIDSVFFGLGAGQRQGTTQGAPDRGTSNASAFVELQDGFPNASIRVTGNGIDQEKSFTNMRNALDEEQLISSALRIRMVYDFGTQTITWTLDYDYNGTFEEEQVLPATTVGTQASEWLGGDRASVFFGGDSGAIFTDLEITVSEPTVPSPPSGLTVDSFGDSFVTLSWTDLTPGNTYSVYRSETSGNYGDPAIPIASGLTTTSYTDSTATNDTQYFYVITQSDSTPTESAFSAEVSATPTDVILPPSNLIAFNAGVDTLYLDWDDLVADFDSYSVYRSDDGTEFIEIASGLTASEYFDTTALSGTAWDYYVVAVKSGNESEASNLIEFQESSPIEVFVDFDSFGSDTNSDTAAYTAASGTTWVGLDQGTAATSNLIGASGVATRVGISELSPSAGNRANGYSVGGNHTPLDDGSQTLGTSYSLMRDYHWRNNGTWSYTISGLVPGRPYDLYLYGYGDNDGQNTAFQVDGQLKQTSNPQGLTNLTEGRHYVTFTVVPDANGGVVVNWGSLSQYPSLTDADNNSAFAAANGFQLVENGDAVLQPKNVIAFGGDDSVSLEWDNVAGATGYKVYRSTTRASGYTLLSASLTESSYTDATALNGTDYFYVVTALNGASESFISSEAAATPQSGGSDSDNDGLSDADEIILGTSPSDPDDFFINKSSSVSNSGGNYDISFVINGAQGKYYHIERSTSLLDGSWTPLTTPTLWTWSTGVLDDNTLTATGVPPAAGGKEFFRVVGSDTP